MIRLNGRPEPRKNYDKTLRQTWAAAEENLKCTNVLCIRI